MDGDRALPLDPETARLVRAVAPVLVRLREDLQARLDAFEATLADRMGDRTAQVADRIDGTRRRAEDAMRQSAEAVRALADMVVQETRAIPDRISQQLGMILPARDSRAEDAIRQSVEEVRRLGDRVTQEAATIPERITQQLDVLFAPRDSRAADAIRQNAEVVRSLADMVAQETRAIPDRIIQQLSVLPSPIDDVRRHAEEAMRQSAEAVRALAEQVAQETRAMPDRITQQMALLPRPRDGRDGHLTIAHAHVTGRSYNPGEVTRFRGGTWQAIDRTTEQPGPEATTWRCLADGVNTIFGVHDPDDPRAFIFGLDRSDGLRHELTTRFPIPLHRRQYQGGVVYEMGDEVALEGSTWRCLVERASTSPPSHEWALVAQRGGRGKQGEQGLQGDRGETGASGRDGKQGARGERGARGVSVKDVRLDAPGVIVFQFDDETFSAPLDLTSMRYVGPYEPGQTYDQGDIVRLGYNLWVARARTDSVPSNANDAWGLFLPGVEPSGGGGGAVTPPGGGPFVQISGDVMTGALQLPNGTVGAPALRIGGADTGLLRAGANVGLSLQGTETFLWTSALTFCRTDLDLGGNLISNLDDPVVDLDGVNKRYVDSLARLDLYAGEWNVGANTPDLTALAPPPLNGARYLCVTANSAIGEIPPVAIPGLTGRTIFNGSYVIWSEGQGLWNLLVAGSLSKAEADTLYLSLDGGTMRGDIELAGLPTLPEHAASKAYVDLMSLVPIGPTPPPAPEPGQLWWRNDPDGVLYIRYDDGTTENWVVASPQGAGNAVVIYGDTPPANPTPGMMWWRSDPDGDLYIYYDDGTGNPVWVAMAKPMGTVATTVRGRMPPPQFPPNPAQGDDYTAPNGGSYRWDGQVWQALGALSIDAPSDGQIYGRMDAQWAAITPGAPPIVDAPQDGTLYGRLDGGWTASVPRAGGTMTGLLLLSDDPVADLGAATKQYVDALPRLVDAPADGITYARLDNTWVGAVNLAGDTMAGMLTLFANPTNNMHAATKSYVDQVATVGDLYQGVWQVAANTPDLNPPVPPPEHGHRYLCVTVDTDVLEQRGSMPGIGGRAIFNGSYIIWDEPLARWDYRGWQPDRAGSRPALPAA